MGKSSRRLFDTVLTCHNFFTDETFELEVQCSQLEIDSKLLVCRWDASNSDPSQLSICQYAKNIFFKPVVGGTFVHDMYRLEFNVEYTVTVKSKGKKGTCKFLLQTSGTLIVFQKPVEISVRQSSLT